MTEYEMKRIVNHTIIGTQITLLVIALTTTIMIPIWLGYGMMVGGVMIFLFVLAAIIGIGYLVGRWLFR